MRDPMNRGLKANRPPLRYNQRHMVTMRDPMNRGLKANRPPLRYIQRHMVTMRDPMNRGLKGSDQDLAESWLQRNNERPDEQGTESVLSFSSSSLASLVTMRDPMNRGLKDRPSSGSLSYRNGSNNERPDEQGTESTNKYDKNRDMI